MFDDLLKAERMALADIDDSRRPAWIVADDRAMRAELATAIEAGGARVVRQMLVAEAPAALADRIHGTLLVVECDCDSVLSPAMAELLDRLDAAAVDPGGAAIIGLPLSAIDDVTARVSAPFASLLCAPTMAERIAAVSLAEVPVAHHFAEADTMSDTVRLQQLAEEVGRIARVLAGYADAGKGSRSAVADGLIGYRAEPPKPVVAPQAVRADDVRAIIRLRRQRDRIFPADLFADPAWDMMLDLMAARIERLKVAVSSLCIAAAVPPTTALRWIRTLTDLGIFVRVADPTDGRRVFIELSDAAAAKVLDFLGEVKRTSGTLA